MSRLVYLRGITHFYLSCILWLKEQNDSALTFRSLFVLFTLYTEGSKTGEQLDTILMYNARQYCSKFIDCSLVRIVTNKHSYKKNLYILSRSGEDLISRLIAFIDKQ